MQAIAIDVGGTQTRVAAVGLDGCIIASQRYLTPSNCSAADFVVHLAKAIGDVQGPLEEIPISIGLAVPGILDLDRGCVFKAVNLPILEGFPIVDRLREAANLPVTMVSDADAATWGEYLCRPSASTRSLPAPSRAPSTPDASSCAVQPPQPFVHVRIGTGVACGWVREGRLQPIEPRRTGHLDMLVVDHSRQAATCRCGKRGCLDTVASGYALMQHTAELGLENGLDDLQCAWDRGVPHARRVVTEAAGAVRKAVRRIAEELKPEDICIGGGVVDHLPALLREAALEPSARRTAGASNEDGSPRIVAAALGDDAGLIGAARLAMSAQ